MKYTATQLWDLLWLRVAYREKQSLRDYGEVASHLSVESFKRSVAKMESIGVGQTKQSALVGLKDLDRAWREGDTLLQAFIEEARRTLGIDYPSVIRSVDASMKRVMKGGKIKDDTEFHLLSEHAGETDVPEEIEAIHRAVEEYRARTGKAI